MVSMAKCSYCNSSIILGGIRDQDLIFCNQSCQQNGFLIRIAREIPSDYLEEAVMSTYSGQCPICQGRGPVDVHISHRVWSILVMTSWSSRPQVCCNSCGVKSKLGDTLFSLVLGWWGFPWGMIFTPVQVTRNLIGLASTSSSGRPSEKLRNIVGVQLAAALVEAEQQRAHSQPSGPPPPLPQ
jgi:hypothetical protein